MTVEKLKIKVFPRHAPGYAGHVKILIKYAYFIFKYTVCCKNPTLCIVCVPACHSSLRKSALQKQNCTSQSRRLCKTSRVGDRTSSLSLYLLKSALVCLLLLTHPSSAQYFRYIMEGKLFKIYYYNQYFIALR